MFLLLLTKPSYKDGVLDPISVITNLPMPETLVHSHILKFQPYRVVTGLTYIENFDSTLANFSETY
jgi:hypothetical protein